MRESSKSPMQQTIGEIQPADFSLVIELRPLVVHGFIYDGSNDQSLGFVLNYLPLQMPN
jgi:hypothetical protein